MKRFRLAPGISLLCLLSFATSAAAECAWVLWGIDARQLPREVYQPIGAMATLEDCLEVEKRMGDLAKAFRTKCLPDTIDPRGPKGK